MSKRKGKRKGITEKLLFIVSEVLRATDAYSERIFFDSYLPYKQVKWYRAQKRKLQKDFCRLRKYGYLERVIENGEVKFKLTISGKEKLERSYPVFSLVKNGWDGKWRLVIFDIEEKERQRRDDLRKVLRSLGLGMMQESVWVTPYDLGEVLKRNLKRWNFQEEVIVLEATRLFGEDERDLALKIWKLKKLSDSYKEWLVRVNKVDFTKEELVNEYLDILKKDPILPDDLLPSFWLGKRARKAFLRLIKK